MPKTNTPEPDMQPESEMPPDTVPGEPIASDPEPEPKPPQRSALDDPAHPLHHLRNA